MDFSVQSGETGLILRQDEISHLNNALNEVCNGFDVANFEAAIGLPKRDAITLLQRIHVFKAEAPFPITMREIDALRNSLTTVMAELDSWEYATRMGFEVDESKSLRNRLDAIAVQAHHAPLRQTA